MRASMERKARHGRGCSECVGVVRLGGIKEDFAARRLAKLPANVGRSRPELSLDVRRGSECESARQFSARRALFHIVNETGTTAMVPELGLARRAWRIAYSSLNRADLFAEFCSAAAMRNAEAAQFVRRDRPAVIVCRRNPSRPRAGLHACFSRG
jgi:hypothetical protein